MGMITARRMREKMAREAAGLPPPEPPRPDNIPTHEHDRVVSELNKAHSAELAAARESSGAAGAQKALAAKDREIAALRKQLEATAASSVKENTRDLIGEPEAPAEPPKPPKRGR